MITESDLEFRYGRATMPVGAFTLSIINPDRQAVIDEGKQYSPSYTLGHDAWIDVGADDNTFEVCLLDQWDESWQIPEFEEYEHDDYGETIYRFVPRQKVIDYLNEKREI